MPSTRLSETLLLTNIPGKALPHPELKVPALVMGMGGKSTGKGKVEVAFQSLSIIPYHHSQSPI